MSLDIRNGTPATLAAAIVTTSWVRDDFGGGRRRYKVFAMHCAVMGAITPDIRIDAQHPRLAAPPAVIGEVTVEVPNLEVAKILYAALGEMLAKQPPEIVQVKTA
jgi:hypothetical protein